MTATSTYTLSSTFTITHARHIASKIAGDLELGALYYGKPAPSAIPDYADELATMLRDGYVSSYEFGFKRDGRRVVCWRYDVRADGTVDCDDSSGKLFAYAQTDNAVFYNFMSYSQKWWDLSNAERIRVKAGLPVQRSNGYLPSDGDGYWVVDKRYRSNGVGTVRRTFRPSMS